MHENLTSDYAAFFFDKLLSVQRESIALFLKDCDASYDASQGSLVVECNSSTLAAILTTQEDCFVIPPILQGVGLVVRSPQGETLICPQQDMEETASPQPQIEILTESEAIALANAAEFPAGITLFRKHGLRPMYVNSRMADFVGMSVDQILLDQPLLLYRYSDNALASLNQLEARLLRHGSVEEFALTSERSSGDRGTYTIDARLVRWAGMDARLTFYRQFSPVR